MKVGLQMTAIHIPPSWKLPERLATSESVFLDRRRLVAGFGLGALRLVLGGGALRAGERAERGMLDPALGSRFGDLFPAPRNAAYALGEDRTLTPEAVAGRFNNFYEFTTDKARVWEMARAYTLPPWKIEVTGLVRRPRILDLDELFKLAPLEERLYRFRCVERWAMQVPWTGYPLRRLIDHLQPLGSARYVRFVSLQDRKGLKGQALQPWFPWPYFEGLRLDEARHELAFVALGSYGHALPMQHGAPWRLALPWKYGYKGAKAVVRIEFTEKRPETFWHKTAPREYGFFSNIDPAKPHPRWSQALERDIGTGATRPTLLYGGYAEEVGSLYRGDEF